MFRGRYLCGCDPNDEFLQRYQCTVTPTGEMSFKRYDHEGYEVCPQHGKRMYGWASPIKQGPQGNTIADWHSWYLANFGRGTLEINQTITEDHRDNRDPTVVGNALLAQRKRTKTSKKASGNGNVL